MPAKDATIYRLGCPEDAPAIRAILQEARLSFPQPADRERHTRSPIGRVFAAVCQQGMDIRGVLQWRDLAEELEILGLAVAAKHRRAGHASFLLENFLREAALTAARHIFLEVRESNTPAVALYDKFGFTRVGCRPNYYREPVEAAVLMRFTLSPP